MDYHPIASIFPMLVEDDLQGLADDIREHGLRQPIILFEDKILDGRNRQTACLLAGADPVYEVFDGSVSEAFDLVWSENVYRRHLQSGQAAACHVKREQLQAELAAAVELVREDARSRQRKGGEEKVRQIFAEPDEQKTDTHRAKLAGTNRQYINDADKLAESAPELLEEVAEGKKTLPQAKRELKDRERAEKRAEAAEQIESAATLEEALSAAKFTTICIDPPWDWNDEGDNSQLGRGDTTYGSMSHEELLEFPVGNYADSDAHIYLWITNRSLPKGFSLLEAWGFRYVTCVTWCKPSFGMGNYFRGSSEQILFGVRGSMPLLRKNAGTWFEAERGKGGHSSKPDAFYDLVQSCSPGPYLDVFSRVDRDGWTCWGGQL